MTRLPTGRMVFLVAFALFCAATAPGLRAGDSGELGAAAFTLGVAHETGFPLWCLLARAAALVPLGEVATRIALFSSLCGALAATGVHRLVGELLEGSPLGAGAAWVASLAGAAHLALGYGMWRQSTALSVEAPLAAALVGMLLLFRRAAAGDRPAGLALALALGLSFGLHPSLTLLLLGPAIVLFAWRLRRGNRWPLLAPLLSAVGGAVVAYLPLRAARDPARVAGLRNLGQLLDFLVAMRLRRAHAAELFSHDLARVAASLRAFLVLIESLLGLPALALAVVGLAWLVARRRPLGLTLITVLAGDLVYVAWANPLSLAAGRAGIPTAIAIAALAGVGMGLVAGRLGGREATPVVRRFARPAAALALAGLVLVPALLAGGERFPTAEPALAHADNAFRDLPPRALVVVHSEAIAGAARYAQTAGGLRPDVTVLDRDEVWDPDYLTRLAARSGVELIDTKDLSAWRALPERERRRRQPTFLRTLVEYNVARRAVRSEAGGDVLPLGSPLPAD